MRRRKKGDLFLDEVAPRVPSGGNYIGAGAEESGGGGAVFSEFVKRNPLRLAVTSIYQQELEQREPESFRHLGEFEAFEHAEHLLVELPATEQGEWIAKARARLEADATTWERDLGVTVSDNLGVTVTVAGNLSRTGLAAATRSSASSSAQDGALPPGDGAAAPGAAARAKRGRASGVGNRAQAVSSGAVIGAGGGGDQIVGPELHLPENRSALNLPVKIANGTVSWDRGRMSYHALHYRHGDRKGKEKWIKPKIWGLCESNNPKCYCATAVAARSTRFHKKCAEEHITCKLSLIEALQEKDRTYQDHDNPGEWGRIRWRKLEGEG